MRGSKIVAAAFACFAMACAATAVEVAPDESLQPASYTKYGLPALNRPWSVEDYTAAATLLERVATEQPLRLPRLNSPRSGPIFRQMVAPANLAGVADAQVSLMERARLFGEYSGALQRMMKAYSAAEQRTGHVYIDEQFAFQLFTLRALLAGDGLLGETLAALPPGSADGASLSATRGDVRETLGKSLLSTMNLLRITRYSFADERLAAMRDLQPLMPEVYRVIPAATRGTLKQQLAEMRDHEADPMWRVCASTLDALAAVDDPARDAKARTLGARTATPGVIRGGR